MSIAPDDAKGMEKRELMATTTEQKVADVGTASVERPHARRRPVRTAAKWVAVAGMFVLLVGGIVYGVSSVSLLTTDNSQRGALTHTVQRGMLRITVTEDGNVESASNVDVKCQVAGGGTILWIVEDGKQVKKGEVLIRLDDAALIDQLNAQKIIYEKALATKIQAEEDFEAAKIAVQEYTEGTFVQQLQDMETQITIALENLRSAENLLEHTQRMARKGFVTPLQLEADQFAVQRAKLELDSARTAKKVLVEFTKPKMIRELEAARDAAEARKRSEDAAFQLEKDRLERLEAQLDNCIIRAPTDGMVVWANESGRRRQEAPQVEEGAIVREQQTLIRLPDLTQMQVKVTVHETKVDMIELAMPANITVQERRLTGRVVSLANQPEPASWWTPDVKEYGTTVKIDGEANGLKPGMTAEVEILVAELTDVLMAPVAAVVEQRGKFYAWVATPEDPQRRELVLGRTNDKFIEIRDGLREGERVLLNPRAVVEEARQDQNQVDEEEQPTQGGAGANASGGETDAAPGADPNLPAAGRARSAEPRLPAAGQQQPNASDFLGRIDTDGDGRISRSEAPPQMQSFFERIDGNADGFLDRAELSTMRQMMQQGRSRPGAAEGQP